MAGVLLMIATGLTWAIFGAVVSHSARKGADLIGMLTVSGLCSITATGVLLVDHGALLQGEVPLLGWTALVIIPSGALSGIGLLLIRRAMKKGHNAATWVISQSALVWPFLAGVLLFGEPLPWTRLFGALAILGSLFLFARLRTPDPRAAPPPTPAATMTEPEVGAQGSADLSASAGEDTGVQARWFAFALAAFLCLGMQQTLTTLPSYWEGWSDAARMRVPMVLSGLILCYGFLLARARRWPSRRTARIGVALSLNQILSCLFLFAGLDELAEEQMVSVGYPLAVGTCVIAFSLYSAVILREETPARNLIGMGLGLLGVLLLST